MATPKASRTRKADQALILAEALSVSLGGLLAMAEMMKRQALPVAARAQLAAVLRSGQRMSRTLEDVLGAPAPAALERLCLRDLLEEIETAAREREEGGAAKALISMHFSPDLHVEVERARLARLLTLLIDGARRRARSGLVEIDVQVTPEGPDEVRLEARLHGLRSAGPEDRLRFDLAENLARSLSGGLLRASAPDGEGLSLSVRLRVADERLPSDAEEAEDAPLPERTHLLIVDDNATNRMVAAALCSMFGCTSETAEDGLEAVEAVRTRAFDLILMDIKMPRMDGIAATRAIRALNGPAAATPIVALTANGDPDAVSTCLEAGMAAVVDKPIKPAQLLLAMQEALGVPLAQTSNRARPMPARHAPAA